MKCPRCGQDEALFEISMTLREMLKIMSTTPSGIAALQQAVADLTAAVTSATAALQNTGDSDTTVADLASQVEAQATALKAATPA